MKIILKYFKPFALMAVLSLALLFCQTIMELFLPRYMSEIVDVGIIKGGVTEAVPRAISAEDYEVLSQHADLEGYGHTDTVPKDFPEFDIAKDYILLDSSLTDLDKNPAAQAAAEAYTKAVLSVLSPDMLTEYNWSENSVLYEQMGAQYTRDLYDHLGVDKHAIQQRSILGTGSIMLLITLLGAAITILNGFLSARISTGIGRAIRHDIFSKIQTFSPSEFDKFSTASLITRSQNDVQRVQMIAMMALRMIFQAPIMGVGGVIMAVSTSVRLSGIVAITVVLTFGIQITMMSKVFPKFRIMQKLQDKLTLVTRETLNGMYVIRAFGNEEKEYDRFREANQEIKDTNMFVQRMMAIQNPITQFINGISSLVIIYLAVRLIAANQLQIGQLMAFSQYVMQIMMAFMGITMMFIMIPQSLVSARRIQEVLDTNTEIADPPADRVKTLNGKAKGELVFNNVSFRYQDAEKSVLENIDFTAKAGEITAFIGSTGSGKSTLINLIPRFYDVTEGSITLDGVDIRDLTVKELRDNLGYVPQKGTLFSGNIESNLSYGDANATNADMEEALKVAQADFVFAEKDGLKTEISQGGDNVSGGQKQRLSIARALVRKPAVYIFDDSFSALDFKTDAKLRRALHGYTNNATTLIVAQRVSTIMNAHQIIVLDSGKVIGKGTHRELLESCEEYREIAESQLTKEELL